MENIEFEYYNFNQITTRKVFRYIFLGVSVILLKLMVRGPIGDTESYFEEIDAPFWLYATNSFLFLFVLILLFNNIFSHLKPKGKIFLKETSIIFKLSAECKTIQSADIEELRLVPLYNFSKLEKGKRALKLLLKSNDQVRSFDVLLSFSEEKEIKRIIESIN